jgi:hypothetical protein
MSMSFIWLRESHQKEFTDGKNFSMTFRSYVDIVPLQGGLGDLMSMKSYHRNDAASSEEVIFSLESYNIEPKILCKRSSTVK